MRRAKRLTSGFVRGAIKRQSVWDVGNHVLYEFCRRHPGHRDDAEIIGKVWLIGRSYAAAVERRSGRLDVTGDNFYIDVVAPAIRQGRIDRWLLPLRDLRRPDADVVLPAHARLTALFKQISDQEKRSLAAKYLHFHFPRAVYLFDERASRTVRQLTAGRRMKQYTHEEYDPAYARFFLRCVELHKELEQLAGRRLSPRDVDKVLLDVAADGR